jgi:hypothetical protein
MRKWRVIVSLLMLSLFIMPLTAYGCANSPVTSTYEFSDFTHIDIQNAFDAQIVQSATYGVTITSSKSLVDYLSVTKTGDTLTIKLQPNHPFTDFILMRKTLKAKIMMPTLGGITLSGISHCTVKGFKSTNTIELDVSGASSMKLEKIETANANFTVSGASKLEGQATAISLKLDVSGASNAELSGESGDTQLTASGFSKVNLEQFITQTAKVTLSGASEVTVDARKDLSGSLTGASRLFFLNNPTVEVEVFGASTLKHK